MTPQEINSLIQEHKVDTNLISDGFHTFGELYAHRIALWITACELTSDSDGLYGAENSVWRSKLHSDGSTIEGWFVLGMNYKAGEQITYHLPISYWDTCWFAKVLDKAPEWDGHTSSDVLARL